MEKINVVLKDQSVEQLQALGYKIMKLLQETQKQAQQYQNAIIAIDQEINGREQVVKSEPVDEPIETAVI